MIKKLLLIILSVFIIETNMLCANASENILKGVNVKKGLNCYNIELITDAPGNAAKNIISNNRIILNLENTTAAGNIKTKFEGYNDINNIIIESSDKNKTSIMIQGENIAYSDIQFKKMDTTSAILEKIKTSSNKSKNIKYGIIVLLIGFIIGELRFIKTKYDELKNEKKAILKNIEETNDFKDYLPGYSKTGTKKLYTTPVYKTNFKSVITPPERQNRIAGNITLNKLINCSTGIIYNNKIMNNTPSFGSLSKLTIKTSDRISNPIMHTSLASKIGSQKAIISYNGSNNITNNNQETIYSRLNKVY